MKTKKQRKIKAWMGFTDGKPYLSYNPLHDKQEYCVYKTKKVARVDFDDVRPVIISIRK